VSVHAGQLVPGRAARQEGLGALWRPHTVRGPANAVDGGSSNSTANARRTSNPNSRAMDQAAGVNPNMSGGGIQYVPVIGC
jgi:hypothetical protein